MSVTYTKLAARVQSRLNEHGIELTQAQLQTFLRVAFFEIGDSLASGEDVFLEGFGRFFPDYKQPRQIKSGLTKSAHMTKKKVFVRFTAFDKLSQQVQKYLKKLGVEIEEDTDVTAA